jgi:hypothetical protein
VDKIPEKITFNLPSKIEVKWDNKIIRNCGHEDSICKVLIHGPEDLSSSERLLFDCQFNSLCSECFNKWKNKFWEDKNEV